MRKREPYGKYRKRARRNDVCARQEGPVYGGEVCAESQSRHWQGDPESVFAGKSRHVPQARTNGVLLLGC
eukprot:6037556-Heterocapsa_arctica.AAC.1